MGNENNKIINENDITNEDTVNENENIANDESNIIIESVNVPNDNADITEENQPHEKTTAGKINEVVHHYTWVSIIVSVVIAFFLGIAINNVMTVSKEDYNALQSYHDSLKQAYEKVHKEHAELKDTYAAYKAKMEPYEEIQLIDAQYKAEQQKQEMQQKKEAEERAAAEEKARKEAEEKAAAEARAAEEAKGYETGITFDNLARTPNDYIGKKVKFKGKVVQVLEGSTETQIRLAVNGDYDQIIFCRVPKAKTANTRILEDDYIHIMGVSNGLISYESTMGGTITIPDVSVDDWGQS